MSITDQPPTIEGAADLSPDLVRIALRDNPLRRHLIVSRVLGKHIPARPRAILDSAQGLASLVSAIMRTRSSSDGTDEQALVIGFAETATGLSECVADALSALRSGHSTRYLRSGDVVDRGFSEDHSHASEHAIVTGVIPRSGYSYVIIVDDELTTGRTAINLVAEIKAVQPSVTFIIASLIDARTSTSRSEMAARCAALGLDVTVVALAAVAGSAVADVAAQFASIGRAAPAASSTPAHNRSTVARHTNAIMTAKWPPGLDLGSRRGWGREERALVRQQINLLADEIAIVLAEDGHSDMGDVLVLGTEEFMYVPLLLADALDTSALRERIWSSSTTRSPGLVLDAPGYGLRNGFSYRINLPSETRALRFAYNTGETPGGAGRFDTIIVCCDDVTTASASAGPEGLADGLAGAASRIILLQFTTESDE